MLIGENLRSLKKIILIGEQSDTLKSDIKRSLNLSNRLSLLRKDLKSQEANPLVISVVKVDITIITTKLRLKLIVLI